MTVLWVVFGAGWFLSGTAIFVREGRLLRRRRGCLPAVGSVVSVREDPSTGQRRYRPTVSLVDAHGQVVTVETLNLSYRPDLARGDLVDLLVDPVIGTTVLLADKTVQVINAAIGGVALLIGAGMLTVFAWAVQH